MASRHLARALVLQTLFESDMTRGLTLDASQATLARNAKEFSLAPQDRAFADALLRGIISKREEIDQVIREAAPQWPIENVAPIDRNVLRLGLYELLFGDRASVPPKVALNEAIEIAKSFGGEQSGKFVNGVLGSVYRELGEPMKDDAHKKTPTEEVAHAGAVVVSGEGSDAWVALVEDVFHRWTLPKARLEDGELTEAAARRAITHELGLSVQALTPLGEHRYTAHDPEAGPVTKVVSFFRATVPEGSALKCTVCEGITDARWFKKSELPEHMYEDVRAIIERAIA